MIYHHLAGFIEGLKEGAQVTLEGAAYPLPGNAYRFMTAKLAINGKEYYLDNWN